MEGFGAKLRAKLEKLRANRERGKYLLAQEEDQEERGVHVPTGEGAGTGQYTPPNQWENQTSTGRDATYELEVKKQANTNGRGRTRRRWKEEKADRTRERRQGLGVDKADTIQMAETLGEMLSAVDPSEEGALEGPVFEELAARMTAQQSAIEQKILELSSINDEENLAEALDMNDAIQFVLEAYKTLRHRIDQTEKGKRTDAREFNATNPREADVPHTRKTSSGGGPFGPLRGSPTEQPTAMAAEPEGPPPAANDGTADLLGLNDLASEDLQQAQVDPFVGSPNYNPGKPDA